MSNDLVGVIEAIVAKPIEDQSDLTTNQKSTNIDGLSALPLFGSKNQFAVGNPETVGEPTLTSDHLPKFGHPQERKTKEVYWSTHRAILQPSKCTLHIFFEEF